MRDIGKNIRDLRERSGLTQEALAEKLFVTRQTVSNYETGKTRPDLDMLLRIAGTLNTDANTVLYGIPVPPKRKQLLWQFFTAAGVFLGLLLTVLVLRPIARSYTARTYLVSFYTLVDLLLIPLLWVLGGFFLTGLGRLCLDSHRELPPWGKWGCRSLLVLWGIGLAMLLALCGFQIYGDILSVTRDTVHLSFSLGKALDLFAFGIQWLTLYAAPVWLIPGFLLAILRKPKTSP